MTVKIDQQQRCIVTSMSGGLILFKTLFGGIWLFVGGLGVYGLLTGGEVTVNGRPGTPDDVWLPGIFAVIGFAIFAFRYRRSIDLSVNTVTRRWGFLLLLFRKSTTLAPIEAVKIDKERRSTKSGSYSVYVVKLQLNGDELLSIDESREKQDARRIAEDVAKLCHRSIYDASEGKIIKREVSALDQPLVSAETQPARRPPLPDGIFLQNNDGTGTVLKLPSGPIAFRLFVLIVPFFMAVGFWWFVWYQPERGLSEDASLFLTLFNYAPLIMFGIPILAALFKPRPGGDKVIIKGGALSVGRKKIPITELEELVVTSKGLSAHSDRMTIHFAHGCNRSQRLALREYLLYEIHTNR